MQELDIYAVANSSVGSVRDYANAQSAPLPTLVRGGQYLLRLHLWGEPDDLTPLDASVFQNVVSMAFAIDHDFNEATTPLILVTSGITVSGEGLPDGSSSGSGSASGSVSGSGSASGSASGSQSGSQSGSGSGSGSGTKETIVTIPISNTNTDILKEYIGTQQAVVGLFSELVGRDANNDDIFVLQLQGFSVRNRIIAPEHSYPVISDYGAVIPVDGGGVAGMRLVRGADGVLMPYFFDINEQE